MANPQIAPGQTKTFSVAGIYMQGNSGWDGSATGEEQGTLNPGTPLIWCIDDPTTADAGDSTTAHGWLAYLNWDQSEIVVTCPDGAAFTSSFTGAASAYCAYCNVYDGSTTTEGDSNDDTYHLGSHFAYVVFDVVMGAAADTSAPPVAYVPGTQPVDVALRPGSVKSYIPSTVQHAQAIYGTSYGTGANLPTASPVWSVIAADSFTFGAQVSPEVGAFADYTTNPGVLYPMIVSALLDFGQDVHIHSAAGIMGQQLSAGASFTQYDSTACSDWKPALSSDGQTWSEQIPASGKRYVQGWVTYGANLYSGTGNDSDTPPYGGRYACAVEMLSISAAGTCPLVSVPLGLTFNTTSGRLTWGAVANVEAYKVYRNGVLVDTVASPTYDAGFDDPGAVYRIQSTNYCGSMSAWSDGLTIPPAPMPPPTWTGRCEGAQLTLSWTAVSGATSYTLRRNGAAVYTGMGLTFVDTSLTVGDGYTYTISASGSMGLLASSVGVVYAPCDPFVPPAAATGGTSWAGTNGAEPVGCTTWTGTGCSGTTWASSGCSFEEMEDGS